VELPKALGAPGVRAILTLSSAVNEFYDVRLSFAQFEAASESAAITAKQVNGSRLRFHISVAMTRRSSASSP
jgi:hypothetical protein